MKMLHPHPDGMEGGVLSKDAKHRSFQDHLPTFHAPDEL